jgi:hypothetical protein
MIPVIAPLQQVVATLNRAGIEAALGGSGLLHSLDLIQNVRDWDLTTDADPAAVLRAVEGLPWEEAPYGSLPFASAFRLKISLGGCQVDLMVRFAITTPDGVCVLPTLPAGFWKGIPVGSPEVWAVAYRLMQRHPKADLLSDHLRHCGANRLAVERLLAEPLPLAVRVEVGSWGITADERG